MLFWENNAILFFSIKRDLPMLKILSLCRLFELLFKKYPLGYTNKGSLILSVLNAVRLRQGAGIMLWRRSVSKLKTINF